jgi:NitT/TauT family transport system substrate-binding protein
VESSVSHYLLARALRMSGLSLQDVSVVNISDTEITTRYASGEVDIVATWNPVLSKLQKSGGTLIFDSRQIPGEIIDIFAVRQSILKANPKLGKALVGAWFEAIALMFDEKKGPAVRTAMAALGKMSLQEFDNELKTTLLFYEPSEGLEFLSNANFALRTADIAQFLADQKLLGSAIGSASEVGIQLPGGQVLGNSNRVVLDFDASFMKLHAEGQHYR